MSNKNKSYQYDQQSRNNKFMEFISKEMMKTRHRQSQLSKNKDNRYSSTNGRNNISKSNHSEVQQIYSHQQLPKQRRGASILRNNSKSKYRQSMSQMKTNVLKDSSMNFYHGLGKTPNNNKMDQAHTLSMFGGNFQQDMEVQQIHYQLVKVTQQAKNALKNT